MSKEIIVTVKPDGSTEVAASGGKTCDQARAIEKALGKTVSSKPTVARSTTTKAQVKQ